MVEHPSPIREVAGSNPVSLKTPLFTPCPSKNAESKFRINWRFDLFSAHSFFGGSQDWVIAY